MFFPITDIFGFGINSSDDTIYAQTSSLDVFHYMQQAIVLAQFCTAHRVNVCVTEKCVLQRLALLVC